ncbi:MAG: hypothetical protein AB7N70_20220, partial [Dehalococcoidia bacterium]
MTTDTIRARANLARERRRQTAQPRAAIHARRRSFAADLWAVAIRALRALPREPEVMIPSLIIPVFFFAVNLGTLL